MRSRTGVATMVDVHKRWMLVVGVLWFLLWGGSASLPGQISGGMLDPNVDVPGEPFSYFWHPTDVIGALYAPVATEVTPEGYLYTGFGELMFYVGNPPEPVDQRIKNLYKNYLPIVQYRLQRQGVTYNFTFFAADLGGGLEGLPVNFVKVQVRNDSREERTAFVSSALRFSAPHNKLGGTTQYRFPQRFDLIPNAYTEGQTRFNPDWHYSLSGDALWRDGRMLYLYPLPYDQVSLSLGDRGFRVWRFLSGEVEGDRNPKYTLDPHTPMGVVTYRLPLKPNQSQSLIFKMPIVPLPDGSPELEQVQAADYEKKFQETVSFWEGFVGKSPRLRFPEAKVQNALLANIISNLLAIDKVGDEYHMNVNKFQYHRFYPTDSALQDAAMDDAGMEKIARDCMLYDVRVQRADGSFPSSVGSSVSMNQLWEGFGHVLWIWGRHYLLTRDMDFLQQVYPGVLKVMDWEMKVTASDPLGLMPVASVHDDAQLKDSHQSGQDLWALAGLKNAIRMAQAMGKSEDADRFQAEYDRFWKAFEKQLSIQTAKSGGYIPPSLDRTLGGNDWDNMHTLYPEPLFEPFDPRVTATLRHTRSTYVEGILPYVFPDAIAKTSEGYVFETRPGLHYFHTPDNSEAQLVRGDPEDQELTVKDLYAMLLHTTSTHATQECSSYSWSTRDFMTDLNLTPDGSTTGVLIELMRNMLVREYKNDLYFFSAVSPAWMQPGKTLEVVNEPTVFGPVNAILRTNSDGWDVKLSNQFRQAPAHVVIRIPWFYEVQQAEADGQQVQVKGGELILPADTHEVKVKGRIKPGVAPLSFERAVDDYKAEYKKRYQEFLRTGLTRP